MRKLLRLIDANLNRSCEGLRVCEDISRFILNERSLTRSFKSLRHKINVLAKKLSVENKLDILISRNVKNDIGKETHSKEKSRRGVRDVFYANSQRTKESLRVLEEITKLIDKKAAECFKKIRFSLYGLEKKSHTKLETIRNH